MHTMINNESKQKLERNDFFPTPLYKVKRKKDDIELEKSMFKWVFSVEENVISTQNSNVGGYQSKPCYDFNKLPPEFLNLLKEKLKFLPNFKFGSWWININRSGDFNQTHTHPGADISVVYYLTDNYSSLCFDHPNKHSRSMFLMAMGLPTGVKVNALAGEMVVFPADLPHYVEPNRSDSDRISIAMNLNFTFKDR